MRIKRSIILTLTLALAFPVQAFAKVETMPRVSEEMLAPQFWTKEIKDADKVLADAGKIKHLNESFLSCKDCNMNDLAAMADTFNGEADNRARWKSALSDLSKYLDGKHYDESDKIISGGYVMDILTNLNDPDASSEQEVKYGIITRRSDVRVYPTELIIADDPGDSDFDNVQNSGVRVGEPVVVQGSSTDGKYYYCYSSCVSGWIPSDDIAICRDKEEWLSAWQIPDNEVMVVTDSKITLEDSNTNPEFSGLMLTMGTVLEKVQAYEYGKMIANRSSYYNYPVWIPIRDRNGMYARKKALVSVHHGLSDGYLPLTAENIIKQAYTKLGDTYGWGGMLSSVDCSAYVRDIYKCFGLELPRNTTWQAAMPVEKYDLSLADDEDKKKLFDTLPPGSILFFKGHEMIYLGHDGEDYYVISATSSMMNPGTDDKARVRSVIINTLSERRANGNTWLSDLYEAVVPYAPNEENIMIPVFSVKETPAAGKGKTDTPAADKEPEEEQLPYEPISFDKTWDYADSSKINDGVARLYRSDAKDRKDITICVNAGHGTKGGADVKTPCHPDGSPKIVSGSTAAGATEATAIAKGCTMITGDLEADATLKAAMVTKEELLKAGYDVLMIRETDDVQLDNIARTLIANNNADAHIAIHYDSTANGKGVFFCSVPDDEGYKNMEPVSTCWQLHNKLGKSLIYGLTKQGLPKWGNGELEMDLTQTSYSTVPSVDLEIGDTSSDYSYKELVKAADGIREGLDLFFDKK
ncbi:MAG: SH3 domain-containing protein [Lachnospiraceae bacterium]|nr:SH3 domain-containing protein [Lachnospiraceae bacterium]